MTGIYLLAAIGTLTIGAALGYTGLLLIAGLRSIKHQRRHLARLQAAREARQ